MLVHHREGRQDHETGLVYKQLTGAQFCSFKVNLHAYNYAWNAHFLWFILEKISQNPVYNDKEEYMQDN